MSVTTVEAPGTDHRDPLPPSMVERMTLILDAFPGRFARLTLEDVARGTRLPRSTAHRILDQLVTLNWLDHSSLGYSLGRRALHLGGDEYAHGELRASAAPLVHELMVRTGMTVHLAVLDEGRVQYLDKLGGRTATTVPSRVGGHAPASSTALGKAMLAALPAENVDDLVGARPAARTAHSIADLGVLHQELNRIRDRGGVAYERGECFPGIACVAAAVHGPEGPVGAISLVGDLKAPLERLAPLVAHATHRVSALLFPGRPGRRAGAVRAAC
ncbi:IclR family transcriptional regulator [Amycolatopsis speibonae]|uniref:IclR family transcriptional regulator n=1 Tax=Amycolatopsis speibonae TaxID=1450224 RepID=A0ABV7P4K6_9PSEU